MGLAIRRWLVLLEDKLAGQPWFEPAVVVVGVLVVVLALLAYAAVLTAVLILVEGLTSVFIVSAVNVITMFVLLSRRPVRMFYRRHLF
jgi:hypothetical protein